MGIRFRKSVRIAPGVRLTVSKTGIGVSAGVRGARYSVHSSGRRTKTVGIPGTGVSHVSTSYGGSRSRGSARSAPAAAPVAVTARQAAAALPKAGLFASASEKRYRDGLVAYLSGDKAAAGQAFEAAVAAEPNATSAHLFAAISLTDDVDLPRVIRHLEAVITSDQPWPDKFLAKLLGHATELGIDVKITELISARVPLDHMGASLLLAEAYQLANRLEEAIGLVQQLHEANPGDRAIRLSLADLLLADGDYEGVVETAAGVTNDDDLSVALLHMKAAALSALGHGTAAVDTFKEALAKTANRDESLLHAVRYDRALTFEQLGERAKAKADLERLYAADPHYQDVAERLAALA